MSIPPKVIQPTSKPRKRKNKVPPLTHTENILINQDAKSSVTTSTESTSHPLLATVMPKDEIEFVKPNAKSQNKSSPTLNKQTTTVTPSVPVKKLLTNIHQEIQKQEQPFTAVVASNRHKSGTTSSQQNKSIETTSSTTTVSTSLIEQQTPVQIQHEQLVQRPINRQRKEISDQSNGLNANSSSTKQATITNSVSPTKLVDLIKGYDRFKKT